MTSETRFTAHSTCLTSVSDSVGGTITWTYNTVSSGHHPRVQETTPAGTVTVEYDEIGRRLTLAATGQPSTTYAYDANSRLTAVTQGSQTVTLAYDDAGRRTSLSYPNGVVTSYGYDHANRLLTVNHVKPPATIEALTYQYDAAGNRTALTRANAAASLIPAAVTNTAFDAANQQTRFNSATTNLTYDANGNLTSFTDPSGTTSYTWNARNQLTGISGPSLSASFVYDGVGRRKSKTINGTTTGFWYDGNDVYAELSGGSPAAIYLRSLSIDEPFIRKQSGGDEFYQTDALGSSLILTNSAGASQTTYTYEPFGNTAQAGTASSNPFQLTGREKDGTGLYYYRARFYSPKLQRFVDEDPIGFHGESVNLYAYVWNNPLFQVDPWGLRPGDPFQQEHLAAIDAFDYICRKPLRPDRNWEWGGFIEKRSDGYYYASEPRTDSKSYTVDLRSPMRPTVTAEYHSHSVTGRNAFSPGDRKDSRTGELFPNYLELPNCKGIAKYHPSIGEFPIR